MAQPHPKIPKTPSPPPSGTDAHLYYCEMMVFLFAVNCLIDIPPKKTSQAPPVKRKLEYSLIDPGSRK